MAGKYLDLMPTRGCRPRLTGKEPEINWLLIAGSLRERGSRYGRTSDYGRFSDLPRQRGKLKK